MNRRTPAALTLTDSKWLRLLLLCVLYFAQGVPFGFVTIALVAVLSGEGATAAQTGSLVALATLPWTFKLAWGPLIDSFGLPSFGRRRPWIVLAQLCMAATLLVGVSKADLASEATLATLGVTVFLHNCFASLQDVATDALAIDVLPARERGQANGLMWASKLVGASIGGVGTVVLMERYDLEVAMQAMAALLLVVMLFPLFALERPGDRRFPWSRRGPVEELAGRARAPQPGPIQVVRSLSRALSTQATFVGLLVALVAGACCALVVPIHAEVFTQRLGWSAESYGTVHATFGTAGKLLGAIGGGILCTRIGDRALCLLGSVTGSLTLAVFAATSDWWAHAAYPLRMFLLLHEANMAMVGVGFLTLCMNLSWTTAAATQFTVYMTVSNLGRAVAPLLAGLGLTHPQVYGLAALLALAPAALLPFVDPRTILQRGRALGADTPGKETSVEPAAA